MASDRQDYAKPINRGAVGTGVPKFELDLSQVNSQSNLMLLREQLKNMMGES